MTEKQTLALQKPKLSCQIGITGHRQLGLRADDLAKLEQAIALLLKDIATTYKQLAQDKAAIPVYGVNEPLVPRLLSSLAEGADTHAASAALSVGYQLHCPLPFPRGVYENDFNSPEALAEFKGLMSQADKVLELDGKPGQKDQAYRAAGEVLLRQADIILAIWDGKSNSTSPGTAGVVTAALKYGVPVIWIPLTSQQSMQLHDPREASLTWQPFNIEKLNGLLRWRLLPPSESDNKADPKTNGWLAHWFKPPASGMHFCDAYFKNTIPKSTIVGGIYRLLLSGFSHGIHANAKGNTYINNAEQQWLTLADAAKPPLTLNKATQQYFIRADSLACYYADQYRGTFVLSFILGGVAVLLALLGAPYQGAGHVGPVYAVLELLTIILIAGLILRGKKQDFHQRWVDFRLLAERFRQLSVLAPIGSQFTYELLPYDCQGDQTHVLVDWLIRAHNRAEGIPSVSFDIKYKTQYRNFLLALLKNQAAYHHHNAERNEHIAHNLHRLNYVFLFLIILFCSMHIVCGLFAHGHSLPDWLCGLEMEIRYTIATAVLPAFGAAVAGILSQGEFERIAQRSEGMAIHLDAIANNLKQNEQASVLELSEQAHNAIDIMSQELSDWRVIFRAKPLEMHA
jgi:hypothetical protein